MIDFLERLAPHEATYRHNDTGEDNGDAHIKRQLMGREVVVAITEGRLDFGPWEQIFYGEFDGRRRKRVLVKVIGELRRPDRMRARDGVSVINRSSACYRAEKFGNMDSAARQCSRSLDMLSWSRPDPLTRDLDPSDQCAAA